MKKYLLLLFVVVQFWYAKAATYNVGPTRTYVSPNALYLANVLLDGDIVEIDFATYTGTASLALWSKNNLIIRGIGGRPHMVANNTSIQGKSIWITSGNNITVENIEFSGCVVPDKNGAGIRAEGPDVTIRNCYFHNNENGILTGNPLSGEVLIEYCEFAYNGYGDGQSHNLYIGRVNKLTFRYNYSHHCNIGQSLKSRAKTNLILYNRISDEATGNSSRLIDLPNGGLSIVMGNVLMQGPNAVNNNLVGYGLEGLTNPVSEFYLINNTLINKRTASCIFIHIQPGTTVAQVSNNIFAGTGTLVNGTITAQSNNLIQASIAAIKFVDEVNYNYKLLATSPAINAGTALSNASGYSLVPTLEYVHPVNAESRVIIATIDCGAYEYVAPLNAADFDRTNFKIYPNPTADFVVIENFNEINKIQIIDSMGKIIKDFKPTSNSISLRDLPNGIYFVSCSSALYRTTYKVIKM